MRYSLLLSCMLPFTLMAQPQIVKDITPGVFSSNPSRLIVFYNNLYFFAASPETGYELYGYDGDNVKLEKDIYEGTTDCAPYSPTGRMALLNNKVYFPADNGTNGLELYSYDGGKAVLVSDIAAGKNSSQIDEIIVANGKLYFDASNGTNGKELWEYDPDKNATEQLTFINTGAGSDPDWITEARGKIFFTANSVSTGRELYEFDPASAQLKLVADIYTGAGSSDPSSLLYTGGALYFSASSVEYGRELYKYDANGLQRLTDLNPGAADGFAVHGMYPTIGVAGSELYFAGNDGSLPGFQLYQYNYTTNLATHIATINPAGNAAPSSFIYYANKLFFVADDGTHGQELWTLDKNGSVNMLADINTNSQVFIQPSGMIVFKGSLYFSAYGSAGNELYKYTDPAAAITDVGQGLDVSVFPNPGAGNVFFKFNLDKNELLELSLYDATGRIVYSKKDNTATGAHTIPVNVSSFAKGVYFYRFLNGDGQLCASGRLVKM